MNASKENASEALTYLDSFGPLGTERGQLMHEEGFQFVRRLLQAAVKRLPTEEAITKDKQRKRSYKRKPKAKKASVSNETTPFPEATVSNIPETENSLVMNS